MGTVLKILGIMFIGFWLMVIVGCSMLASAVQHAAKSSPSSYSSSREARREAADRILREIEAERERSDSSYDRNAGERPHFKPGEPMVDPNPSSSYDH